MKKHLLLFSFVVAAVAGCSVRGGKVQNVPPDTSPKMGSLSFGVEEGELRTQVFSVVIWPNEWTPQQREVKTLWINSASNQIIKNIKFLNEAPIVRRKMFAEFRKQGCIEKFQAEPTACDPKAKDDAEGVVCIEEMEVPWVQLPPVGEGQAGYGDYVAKAKELAACQVNQDYRSENRKEEVRRQTGNRTDVKLGEEMDQLTGIVGLKAIITHYLYDADLGIQRTDEEMASLARSMDALEQDPDKKSVKSKIIFNRSGDTSKPPVVVQLVGFHGAKVCEGEPDAQVCRYRVQTSDPRDADGNSVSNDPTAIRGATYDRANRLMKMIVPDTTTQFISPENRFEVEYHFEYYRLANILQVPEQPHPEIPGEVIPAIDAALLKGEVLEKKNGRTTRKGSVQIIGKLTAFPPAAPVDPQNGGGAAGEQPGQQQNPQQQNDNPQNDQPQNDGQPDNGNQPQDGGQPGNNPGTGRDRR